MKTYMLPVDMIARFTESGKPTPIRFKVPDTTDVIQVNRIILQDEEKLAGNRMLIYRCATVMGNEERLFELKYEISSCKWYLYKM